jgi:hypothetical protein
MQVDALQPENLLGQTAGVAGSAAKAADGRVGLMVDASGSPAPARIRARQIGASDIDRVVDLLARGFPSRPRRFWAGVLARLTEHATPAALPKYGYLLESGGSPVGVVLLIASAMQTGGSSTIRCNVSSWYVEPAFRSYASLLAAKTLGHDNVTYLNLTAAPHTRPIVRAQGYSQYSTGIFVAMPALQVFSREAGVRLVEARRHPDADCDPFECDLLLEHEGYGCLSLWAVTSDGAYPFVFRPRVVKGVIGCAQLVYCRDLDNFVRLAGPIGRYLAARARFLIIIDSNGSIPGLAGKYLADRMPKFFQGPDRPRLGDLAYTEVAMFGV